jgi:hypothetical protein
MEPWQERLIEERRELAVKIEKLKAFFHPTRFSIRCPMVSKTF